MEARSDIQIEDHMDECFLRLFVLSLGSLAGLALGVTHALKQTLPGLKWWRTVLLLALLIWTSLSQIFCLGACAAASRWAGMVQRPIGDDTVRGTGGEAC